MMKYTAVIVVIAVVAVSALVIAGRGDKQDNNGSNQPAKSTTQNGGGSTTNQVPSTTNKASISNFTFSPSDITIKKGTTVTWTNNDSVVHTVTVDSGNGPDSDLLQNGQTYSFTFNEVGTFNYHCTPHPYMHGTVNVTE